ncbi:2-C-methyl-D-erythritol 4-phosphate cytidylyltransferase [Lederbergia galactosidilytica]|uniref:2-C-methyl-D-erythritol 4-phosphate cytidylyltransferase n=1 Tax=Lederbergia galactosidilytica TaxID=217031 RepID=A0A178A636_9BACI|nr:2-C-methyl-D-erythritol 4-phosphate cytidylyltransferase [Lederbergia galactosidilytica]KRG14264.1 2-C-methyl-D-erythritol 4-phosphate cytidylyltransferase [Virgibacillus soli]MBP1914332.1 2-C-methyl-D-erythritol 4-phosphate cytidylyltransferase [Lederbergia galactosidilytica]OAK75676.1 2-C-methyl-D-erythritol 4-phosphate cytidylyltransferase [Lederbergia galactosidilytica]
MNYQVIIPAAGLGKRMGAEINKLLLELEGQPIILHTLDLFIQDSKCKRIILVINPSDQKFFDRHLQKDQWKKIILADGGEERQYSVLNGLKVADPEGVILVHDGARPFVKKAVIARLVQSAVQNGAAIAAVPVKDTIKKTEGLHVVETIDRSSLWQVQTPQAFRFSLLYQAHMQAQNDQFLGTDDASLVERMGHSVQIVQSDYDNIKLTTPEDLFFAKAIIDKFRKS